MENKPELTAFISYAHNDRDYVEVLLDGLQKHAKHSRKIHWNIWDDTQIPKGSLWHEVIQEQVRNCDFAIVLVSPSFLYSEYIEKNEFNNFLERQRKEGFRFFPILLQPCDIEQWPELQRIQFFLPDGREYGKSHIHVLSYADLVEFQNSGGRLLPIPNPMRERYHQDLIKALETSIEVLLSKRDSKSKFFKLVKLSHELTQRDILGPGIRSRTTQNFYWRRTIDEDIRRTLEQRQSLFVLGNSLAGKTRAVYQALKEIPDITVLIPADKPKPIADFRLPVTTNTKYYAFFDDIDEYLIQYGQEQLEELLFLFLDKDIPVVATCRTGNEWRTFESTISHRIRENFLTVTIERLEEGEIDDFKALWFANQESKKIALDESAFDRNIGSYFIQLTVMQNRFRDLEQIIRMHHIKVPEALPREILKALKFFYFTENVEGRALYSVTKLKDFCERRMDFNQTEWMGALAVLRDSEYELNFIELIGDTVHIEDAYVENVVEKSLSLDGIIPILKSIYVGQDLRQLGFLDNVRVFNRLVHRAASLHDSHRIIEKMVRLGISPNEATFNILINKAESYSNATALFEKMQQAGLKPNEVTFNSLINKAESYSNATALFEKMQQIGLKPDKVTFNSLINKAESYSDAVVLLEKMQQAGLKSDEVNVTFTSLINKAESYSDAAALLEKMQQAGLKPNEVTFNSLINKAESYSDAAALLEKMQQAGLKPNEVTFNSLINKAESYSDAAALLEKMQQAGLKPNKFTFNSLINKAESYSDAAALLEKMQQAGLKPNKFTFNSLINKAESYSDAAALLEKMQQAGLKPNEVTFNSLINKAESYSDAAALLEKMQQASLKPNEVTFNSLINKAESYSDTATWLEKMQQAGLKPNEVTFNSLINKAESYSDAAALLEKMEQAGLKPNEITLLALLKTARIHPTETLALLFSKFAPDILLTDPFWNQVIIAICQEKELVEQFILPHLAFIELQDDTIKFQFAQVLEAVALRRESLELVETLIEKGFWYLNMKGNCLQDETPEQALIWYQQAYAIAGTEKEHCIALNNAAKVIYKHRLQEHYTNAIHFCYEALSRIPCERFPFPGQTLLLLVAELYNDDTLANLFRDIIQTHDIGVGVVRKAISLIPDKNKRKALREAVRLLSK